MSIPWGQVGVGVLVAALIAGVVYAGIRAAFARRRPRPGLGVSVAEYALVGWVLMFVFVTQVLAFGASMGFRFNLLPLGALYDAWNFGLVNAGTLPQLGLNIVITVPLGILLPIVFPRRFDGFLPLGVAGFSLSLLTELVQFATQRSADIDDVIANTLGVLVGYSLLRLVRAIVSPAARRPRARVAAAVVVVLFAVAPFVAVWAQDARDPAGHLYYGHLRPSSVDVKPELSDEESTGTVYRYVEQESAAELLARLSELTGFSDCDDGASVGASGACAGAANERLFVFPHGGWSVYYTYGEAPDSTKFPVILDSAAAISMAEDAMRELGIDPDSVQYDTALDWQDNAYHLQFSARPSNASPMVWGVVRVDLAQDGTVLGVEDRRGMFERVGDVTTISPQAALQLAQDVGVDEMPGTATVDAVERSYAFNDQTGYLVPSWQITGTFAGLDWTPNMDAHQP